MHILLLLESKPKSGTFPGFETLSREPHLIQKSIFFYQTRLRTGSMEYQPIDNFPRRLPFLRHLLSSRSLVGFLFQSLIRLPVDQLFFLVIGLLSSLVILAPNQKLKVNTFQLHNTKNAINIRESQPFFLPWRCAF